MAQKHPYALARYINQATKQPFEFIIDDKRSIFIEQPDANVVVHSDQAKNTEEALRDLVGDKYDEIMEIIGDAPGGVVKLLVNDLRDHFGLGE
jgi:hypothetical protein